MEFYSKLLFLYTYSISFSKTFVVKDDLNEVKCVNPAERERIPDIRATNIANTFKPPKREQTHGDFIGCAWTITSQYWNEVVKISFSNVHLQSERGCTDEFLAVFEGKDNTTRLLKLFCGVTSPSFVSSGRSFTIQFYTRYRNYEFAVTYHSISENALREDEATKILVSSSLVFILIVPFVAFFFIYTTGTENSQEKGFDDSVTETNDNNVVQISPGQNPSIPKIVISCPAVGVNEIAVVESDTQASEESTASINSVNFSQGEKVTGKTEVKLARDAESRRTRMDEAYMENSRPPSPTGDTDESHGSGHSTCCVDKLGNASCSSISPDSKISDQTIQYAGNLHNQGKQDFETREIPMVRSSSLHLILGCNIIDKLEPHTSKSATYGSGVSEKRTAH